MSSIDLYKRSLVILKHLLKSAEALRAAQPLPSSLCYVPATLRYKATSLAKISIFSEPKTSSSKEAVVDVADLPKDVIFVFCGAEVNNEEGQWMKILKVIKGFPKSPVETRYNSESWVLVSKKKSSDQSSAPLLLPVDTHDGLKVVDNWLDVLIHSSQQPSEYQITPPHQTAVPLLSCPAPKWDEEKDESLVQFLLQADFNSEAETSVWKQVDAITVSSESDMVECLTDGKPDTCWESDGRAGTHWIKLKMKKATFIHGLILTVDGKDGNYMPHIVLVVGRNGSSETTLNRHTISNVHDLRDVVILEETHDYFEFIEIKILECHARGIDTRVHGIKLRTKAESETHIPLHVFSAEALQRFPLLQPYSREQLAARATALLRLTKLFDSCLSLIYPKWEYSTGTFDVLWEIREVLALSKKRLDFFGLFLQDTESKAPSMPKLSISRRLAAEHRENPASDPHFRRSVFWQIYDCLRYKTKDEKQPFDYRWPNSFKQWWECKFMSEGIIDQGGGFRDSLCDLAAELNPSDTNSPVPLPFFIPSPNQLQYDSNVHRDTYIPNPSCRLFHLYEWIGQLMGACVRSQQHLILSLPPFVWKILTRERVSWSRDYRSIDEAEVDLLAGLEKITNPEEWAEIGELRTWTVTLSDGTTWTIPGHHEHEPVKFSQKSEYIKAVKKSRIRESSEQIKAIQKGLLSVVPEAALDLITWKELEEFVSGSPEIPMAKLKASLHLKERDENEAQVKNLYSVLERFSDEDRSFFLRFVTGRRRLPVDVRVEFARGDPIDSLPRSATCGNTLYLPRYSSVESAEERIRYAIYNCVAIDTDRAPI